MRLFILVFFLFFFLNSCSTDNSNNSPLDSQIMDGEPKIYSGNFVSIAHPTMGVVTVNEEKTILKIDGFKTDNGPLLEMYLATNTSVTNYISLGMLKGLDGDYEYALPENLDLDNFKYVIVWCVEFSVNFGHAELTKN